MLRRRAADLVFSPDRHRVGKRRNVGQSVLLLGGMLLILALCAWPLWGWQGVAWALLGGGLALLLTPSVSPEWLLSLYRAREVHPRELPGLLRLSRPSPAAPGCRRRRGCSTSRAGPSTPSRSASRSGPASP
jgi:hypothetical protein